MLTLLRVPSQLPRCAYGARSWVCDPTAVKGNASAASGALDRLPPLIGAGLVRLLRNRQAKS